MQQYNYGRKANSMELVRGKWGKRIFSLCLSLFLVMGMLAEVLVGAVPVEAQTVEEGRSFVHPGMIHTAQSFAAMKKNIDNQVQPNLDTWTLLCSDGFSDASWNPRLLDTVTRGSSPNNYAQFYIDIRRAYQTALI